MANSVHFYLNENNPTLNFSLFLFPSPFNKCKSTNLYCVLRITTYQVSTRHMSIWEHVDDVNNHRIAPYFRKNNQSRPEPRQVFKQGTSYEIFTNLWYMMLEAVVLQCSTFINGASCACLDEPGSNLDFKQPFTRMCVHRALTSYSCRDLSTITHDHSTDQTWHRLTTGPRVFGGQLHPGALFAKFWFWKFGLFLEIHI